MGLLIFFDLDRRAEIAACRGDRPRRHQPSPVLRHHLQPSGEHQANIERAARDLGAGEASVLLLVTAPMMLARPLRLVLSP